MDHFSKLSTTKILESSVQYNLIKYSRQIWPKSCTILENQVRLVTLAIIPLKNRYASKIDPKINFEAINEFRFQNHRYIKSWPKAFAAENLPSGQWLMTRMDITFRHSLNLFVKFYLNQKQDCKRGCNKNTPSVS